MEGVSFVPRLWFFTAFVAIVAGTVLLILGNLLNRLIPWEFSAYRSGCHISFSFNDRCKEIATRAKLDPTKWHLHRFHDTAATRWLRAGIDVRTVQVWLGHESLATTQKYLEPSKETEAQLEAMKLPF